MKSGRYRAYPEYRESEVEWLGRFPSGWSLTRVKYESYVKARVGWHGLKSDDFTDTGPYLVTGSDFSGPTVQWSACYHCDLTRYEQDPYIQLTNGDLLITKDGTIGKVALVKNLEGKATLNSGVFVVRPLADNYTSSFYFWLLQSSIFTGFVDYVKTGSTIVHLYQETFVNFIFCLPSFIEQTKIANFLDHETAKIDRLIEKQQALIALLKEKRQAVISHAVTKGLNPHVPLKESGVEWLGQVPAHWKVSKLKYYATMRGGFAFSSDSFREDGIQLLRIGNVYLNQLELDRQPIFLDPKTTRSHPDFVIQKGDILMSLTGTLGKTDYGFAVIVNENGPFLLNQRVGKIEPARDRISFDYLLYSVRSSSYQSQLYSLPSGTKQANLSNSDVLNIVVSIPPSIEEQRSVVEYIAKRLTELDELIAKAEDASTLLQERRTALISATVTGKIDVRAWQPVGETEAN